MVVAGIIVAVSIYLMLYKLVTLPVLIIAAALGFSIGLLRSRHGHGGFLSIDQYAQRSPLKDVHPGLKTAYAVCAIVISTASRSYVICAVVCALSFACTVIVGRIPIREYLRFLMVPISFISLSSIAITIQVSQSGLSYIDIPAAGLYLSVTRASQIQALRLTASAYAGVSSLYMLGLTTPLPGIIRILNSMHMPKIITELMYLIYRYIFVLVSIQDTMSTAAASRLGYRGYGRTVKTVILIASNLLSMSFRQASLNFDAMEARCYDGTLQFYEEKAKTSPKHVLGFGAAAAVLIVLWALKV